MHMFFLVGNSKKIKQAASIKNKENLYVKHMMSWRTKLVFVFYNFNGLAFVVFQCQFRDRNVCRYHAITVCDLPDNITCV